jgi:hypothetical protein
MLTTIRARLKGTWSIASSIDSSLLSLVFVSTSSGDCWLVAGVNGPVQGSDADRRSEPSDTERDTEGVGDRVGERSIVSMSLNSEDKDIL